MAKASLYHNPGAGDESHSKEYIIQLLAEKNIECRYSSTKDKNWGDDGLDPFSDYVVIAGGDGTVRKVIAMLLKQPVIDSLLPIGIISLGTANNISKTLDLSTDHAQMIDNWEKDQLISFDVGRLFNVPKEDFFIESFGYGIFPFLMMKMKENKEEAEKLAPDEKLIYSLKMLYNIIEEYEPRHCKLIIDGKDHSGHYILAEIMNSKSIGPNLELAANNNPGDGVFEVVLVKGEDKAGFSEYIQNIIEGRNEPYTYKTIQGKDITIAWEGTHVHVDDATVKLKKEEKVFIKMRPGLLNFLGGNGK